MMDPTLIGVLGVLLLFVVFFRSLVDKPKQFMKYHLKKAVLNIHIVIAGVLFIFYIFSVFSTGIVISHNSPINLVNQSFSDISPNQTTITTPQNTSLSLGFTYANRTLPVREQPGVFLGRFILSLVSDSILFVVLLFGLIHLSKLVTPQAAERIQTFLDIEQPLDDSVQSVISITLGTFSTFIYHLVALWLIFSYSEPILIITEKGASQFERVPVTDFSQWFVMLIIVQGIFITGITVVWTRPVLHHDQTEALRVHLENWRQFGTWSATLLGGVLLTTGVVFIADISPFGGQFVWYISILIGGGLVLILGSILYKVKKIEGKIINLLESENR